MKNPFHDILKDVSIDCVIFGFDSQRLKVLLLKWKNSDLCSLPGGRIRHSENLEDAMERTVLERTGLKGVYMQQFYTFGDLNRLHRYGREKTIRVVEAASGIKFENTTLDHRTISVGYYALVNINKVSPMPDAFTDVCIWAEVHDLPDLLFDHNAMVRIALRRLRREFQFQPLGNLLPSKFTLTELRLLYESILDRQLDRRNFHKLVSGHDYLIRLDEKREGTAHKAPYLYKFDLEKFHFAQTTEK